MKNVLPRDSQMFVLFRCVFFVFFKLFVAIACKSLIVRYPLSQYLETLSCIRYSVYFRSLIIQVPKKDHRNEQP